MPDYVPHLSNEDKRQAVYASLVRFAPEAAPLRQRALHRVVLGALIGSSSIEPFRVGKIQQNLSFGADGGAIRTEVIQQTLEELQAQGKVSHTLLRERHAYYLTQEGDAELTNALGSAEGLIRDVVGPLLRDTEHFLSPEVGAAVFTDFIFECFARFGRTIAKQVAGTISREEMLRAVDARSAFEAAIAKHQLNATQRESMQARCVSFLKSAAPYDERLKFFLAQGFYFAHLLGLPNIGFNPLAEGAFSGSVLYLDTNVLILGVLAEPDQKREFLEIMHIARRNGIELRVTRATLNELAVVAADRIPEIEKIVSVLPLELAEKTNDQVLKAFLQAREADPEITPDAFISQVYSIESKLGTDWPMILDDRDEDEIIAERDISQIAEVMKEEAQASRGWGKSLPVLRHDVASYLAVIDERKANRKAWFLTRDNSFAAVSSRLQPDDVPFFFSHLGFVQSISPFVTSTAEERSFADVFSRLLSDQLKPIETLFDMRELSLMAEFHEDVMATPADQLVLAFDYVKNRALDGKPYRESDIPRVSLELRKFLSSDKEQQLRELQLERQRISDQYEAEREQKLAIVQEREDEFARRQQVEGEVRVLKDQLTQMEEQVALTNQTLQSVLQEQRAKALNRQRLQRGVFASLGVLAAALLWFFGQDLVDLLTTQQPQLARASQALEAGVTVFAAIAFTVPTALFIRSFGISKEVKITIVTVLVVLALSMFEVLGEEAVSAWADRIGVGTLIALVFAAYLFRD